MLLLHSGRKTEGSDYRFASLGITSSCDIPTTPSLSVCVSITIGLIISESSNDPLGIIFNTDADASL